MSSTRRINKSLKKNVIRNSGGTISQSLIHYMGPQIQELFTAKWFLTAKEYFANPPPIHILSIDTKEVELLNIIGELRDYLTTIVDSPSIVISNPGSHNFSRELQKIRGIVNNINPKRITRTQRRALRKYIEISPLGRKILRGLFDKIKDAGKIEPEMELIFNPYTSLVNLAEIYSQCNEYSVVRYSVPELGIKEAQIYLYYPAHKRDEYLAQQQQQQQQNGISMPHKTWLSDALYRICFFNKLLNTKKQPRAIHVFLAEFRKEFMHVSGKADLVFTPSEINTGVCDMTDIIITRSEESLKTLLHELIHFHSLDFKHAAHDDFCSRLFNISTEQSSFNLFEAHTECLASILHCLTHVVLELQQQTDKAFQKQFRRVFIEQINYTICKAANILRTSGCDTYNEFITPGAREKCQVRENTNVFSYFFVKSFIYLGLRDWLTGCCDTRTARFLDTRGQRGGLETLKQIIQLGYKNWIFQNIIDAEMHKSKNMSDGSLKMMCIT